MVFASRIVGFESAATEDVAAELERIPHLRVVARCDPEHLVVVIEGRDRRQIQDVLDFARREIPGIVTIDPDG